MGFCHDTFNEKLGRCLKRDVLKEKSLKFKEFEKNERGRTDLTPIALVVGSSAALPLAGELLGRDMKKEKN
jgi:hypothetical protein